MSLDTQEDLVPAPASQAAPEVAPVATGRSQAPAAYSAALAVIVVDQLSKLWFLSKGLMEGDSIPVFGPFNLTMVWNRGVSFGLFRAELGWVRWALTLFSFAVAVAIAIWARKVQRPLLGLAFGLIMGGAIGNMIDRIRLGAVADFLDFQALHFPWVFNIADSAISIGVVLLLVDTYLSDKRPKAAV